MVDIETNSTFNSIPNESKRKFDSVINWENTWGKVSFEQPEQAMEEIKNIFSNYAGDDKAKIKQLFELRNNRGNNLMLNLALWKENAEVLQYLFDKLKSSGLSEEERKSILNMKGLDDYTLLHYVTGAASDAQLVRDLIDEGADVNVANKFNWTPLYNLIVLNENISEKTEFVRILAQKANKEDIKNILYYNNLKEEVKEILEEAMKRFEEPMQENQEVKENEITPVIEDKQTPVLEESREQEETVNEAEQNINAEASKMGDGFDRYLMPVVNVPTVMDWQNTWRHIDFERVEETIKEVQEMFDNWAGEDKTKIKQLLSLKDDKGNTALMGAVRSDNARLVQFLMDKWDALELSEEENAHPLWDMQNDNDWSPLHQAVYRKNALIVQKLIERKANLNLQNDKGWTALFQGVVSKDETIVQNLLNAGADASIASNVGWTPAYRASFDNSVQIEEMIKKSLEKSKEETVLENTFVEPQIQNETEHVQVEVPAQEEVAVQEPVQEEIAVQEENVVQEELQKTPVVQDETFQENEDQEIHLDQIEPVKNEQDRTEIQQEKEKKGIFTRLNNRLNKSWFFTWREVDFEKDTEEEILEKVQELLESGADINVFDEYGDTILMHAAAYGKARVVEYLIAQGADINLMDDDNDNALIMAAYSGHANVVEILMNHNARLNEQNKYGETALISAAREGHFDVVNVLVKNKDVELNMVDNANKTALICAVEEDSLSKREDEKQPFTQIVEVLMKSGADRSKSARSLAVSLGNSTMDRAIRRYEHEISCKEIDEIKKKEEKLASFEKLIDWQEERKALEIMESNRGAIRQKIVSLQKMLEQCSVQAEDTSKTDDLIQLQDENLVLDVKNQTSGKKAKTGLFVRLINSIKKFYMGDWYCSFGQIDWDSSSDEAILKMIQKAVANGASINMQDDNANTLLHYAAFCGKTKVVKYLLENRLKADLNNNKNCTPLMFAATFGYTDIIDELIKHDVDLNAKNKNGESALMQAVKNGRFEVVKKLVQTHKVEVNLTDNNKQTALMVAAENDYAQIVEFLMENGADERMEDDKGQTALTKCGLSGEYSQSFRVIRRCRQKRYAEKDFKEKIKMKKRLLAVKTIFAGDEKDLENNPTAIRERIDLFTDILCQSTDRRRQEALILRNIAERRRRRKNIRQEKRFEISSRGFEEMRNTYISKIRQEVESFEEERQKEYQRISENVYKKISDGFELLRKKNQEGLRLAQEALIRS